MSAQIGSLVSSFILKVAANKAVYQLENGQSLFQDSIMTAHPFLEQEAPKDPTGQALSNIEDVDSSGATDGCDPHWPDFDCGLATWGRQLTPLLGLFVQWLIAFWQLGITFLIFDETVKTTIFVDGKFNTDANLIDYVWLGMCLIHFPPFIAIAISGFFTEITKYGKDHQYAWLDSVFLKASNYAAGSFILFVTIIEFGLFFAAEHDKLWDIGDTKGQIALYLGSTYLTLYLEWEVINAVRQYFYNKNSAGDELENSQQNAGNGDVAKPKPSSSADASQNDNYWDRWNYL